MKSEFLKTRFVHFGFFKHFSQNLGLGVSIADFGSVVPGSNPGQAQDFPNFFSFFAITLTKY